MLSRRNRESDINVDLWPGSCWEADDLRDLQEVVSKFGSTEGQRSHNLRGMGLHITLSFIAGTVASGFFKALGSHLFDQLVTKIRGIVTRPQLRHPEWKADDFSDALFFIVQDRELKLELHLYGSFSGDTELRRYLEVAPNAFFTIMSALTQGRSPCIRGKAHSIQATWSAEKDRWDVGVLVREGDDPNCDDAKMVLSLSAFVPTSKLTIEEWPFIHWMDFESARLQRVRESGSL